MLLGKKYSGYYLVFRAFPVGFGPIIYFISSKSHFFSLITHFDKTPQILFFILQYIILKYYKIILFLYIFFQHSNQTHAQPPHLTSATHYNPVLQQPPTIDTCKSQPTHNKQQPTGSKSQQKPKNQSPPSCHCQNRRVPHCPRPDRPPEEPPPTQTHAGKPKPTTTIPANPPQPKTHSRHNK